MVTSKKKQEQEQKPHKETKSVNLSKETYQRLEGFLLQEQAHQKRRLSFDDAVQMLLDSLAEERKD